VRERFVGIVLAFLWFLVWLALLAVLTLPIKACHARGAGRNDPRFDWGGPTQPRVPSSEAVKRCELLGSCDGTCVVDAWMGPGTGINCVCAETAEEC